MTSWLFFFIFSFLIPQIMFLHITPSSKVCWIMRAFFPSNTVVEIFMVSCSPWPKVSGLSVRVGKLEELWHLPGLWWFQSPCSFYNCIALWEWMDRWRMRCVLLRCWPVYLLCAGVQKFLYIWCLLHEAGERAVHLFPKKDTGHFTARSRFFCWEKLSFVSFFPLACLR